MQNHRYYPVGSTFTFWAIFALLASVGSPSTAQITGTDNRFVQILKDSVKSTVELGSSTVKAGAEAITAVGKVPVIALADAIDIPKQILIPPVKDNDVAFAEIYPKGYIHAEKPAWLDIQIHSHFSANGPYKVSVKSQYPELIRPKNDFIIFKKDETRTSVPLITHWNTKLSESIISVQGNPDEFTGVKTVAHVYSPVVNGFSVSRVISGNATVRPKQDPDVKTIKRYNLKANSYHPSYEILVSLRTPAKTEVTGRITFLKSQELIEFPDFPNIKEGPSKASVVPWTIKEGQSKARLKMRQVKENDGLYLFLQVDNMNPQYIALQFRSMRLQLW